MKKSYKFCNSLVHGCGIAGMKMLDSESIPLVVTSPPYGTIRDYGGDPFYFRPMAKELWRVVTSGGVVCWHVQDQINDGAESAESYRQCLYFLDLGFRLHTTLVIDANSISKHQSRYGQPVQHVFVFSKERPRTFRPIEDLPNMSAGKLQTYKDRRADGTQRIRPSVRTKPFRKRGVLWSYPGGSNNTSDTEARKHPALMPETLAQDLIVSWSNESDVVLDPMSGGGTTAKMALSTNRRYIGFEINREYHDIATARLDAAAKSLMPCEKADKEGSESGPEMKQRKVGIR